MKVSWTPPTTSWAPRIATVCAKITTTMTETTRGNQLLDTAYDKLGTKNDYSVRKDYYNLDGNFPLKPHMSPKMLYLPNEPSPLAFKYGMFGSTIAVLLLNEVTRVDDTLKTYRRTCRRKYLTAEGHFLTGMQAAFRAFTKNHHADLKDQQQFFLGVSLDTCHSAETARYMSEAMKAIPEFGMVFQCKPGQKMFERSEKVCPL
uniref:Peptidase_M13 domain-containing protein n=1 Tax=Steinernema glaseri TaxID=37863 RepID=A0A1I7ZXT3_9BILA